MLKGQIISICNQELSDEELIKAIELAIAKSIPYDHTFDNTQIAVGLKEFDEGEFLEARLPKEGRNSEMIELAEAKMSKRELAYLFIAENSIINHIMENPMARLLLQ